MLITGRVIVSSTACQCFLLSYHSSLINGDGRTEIRAETHPSNNLPTDPFPPQIHLQKPVQTPQCIRQRVPLLVQHHLPQDPQTLSLDERFCEAWVREKRLEVVDGEFAGGFVLGQHALDNCRDVGSAVVVHGCRCTRIRHRRWRLGMLTMAGLDYLEQHKIWL